MATKKKAVKKKSKKIASKKSKGGGKKKSIRTITLQPRELALFVEKRTLTKHYEAVHRATLVDLQLFQKILKDRYKLPQEFTVDTSTGVVTCEANNG